MLDLYINHFNGATPIFISHNSYSNDLILYEQMVWDVDTDRKDSTLEMAYEDLKKLSNEFENNEILLTFSGSGFHFYLEFEPTFLPLSEKLNLKIKNFQREIIDKLDLKTVNLSCAESKRLIRIPTTKYVHIENGENIIENRYSVPINRKILENYSIENILDLSKFPNPTYYEPNLNKKKMSIKKLLDIKINENQLNYKQNFDSIVLDWSHLNERELKYYLSYILDNKIINDLWQIHPNHMVNFLGCLKLKEYGLSLTSALQIFDRISYFANWDNRNLNIQYYQISSIYRRS